MITFRNPHVADPDADLTRSVRHTSVIRQVFYVVVLLVALAGQVLGAHEALGIPIGFAVPAVVALELGGIVVLSNADVRRRLGERAVASRILSAGIAAGAVAFNLATHSDRLLGAFFGGMSALGYLVWLMHTENQRRDRLRATGALPPTTPAYELVGHWLRHPVLTLKARSLAKANPALGLYGSLDAARTQARSERRQAAIAKVLHRKIRTAVDPVTADIATASYNLDEVAARLAASADYDALTSLISTDLHPTRLVNSDADLVTQLERAREAEATALASARDAKAEAERLGTEVTTLAAEAATTTQALDGERARHAETAAELTAALARAEAEAQHRDAADARLDTLVAQMAGLEQARHAAETETAQALDTAAGLARENEALSARLAEAEAHVARLTAQAVEQAKPTVRATAKRQPSAAERVAKAIARSPRASDATIAARLDLSEATVRRHRRQAVDSVSTASETPETKTGRVVELPERRNAAVA
ncbi:hypothetical protein RB614_20295 [Phytohabitans sp. ZYX-F-186]|uniref:DUF2637 domain-containing protein n=1 Tax=Phytohabitans maris TaxID=3071409 RepID=A0ABU0ZIH1_9ACTN|nr:hypothetical protein [Phytohabitans sp. ZYX-F-186]MDQ7906859.1 hypothetical protein [Phytohabitans sp. ZYX-F-186]